MKKNKVLKIVLIVLGALVALLAAAVLGVLFYLHSMAAGIPETLPDAPADSTQVTLTDDEIDKLLSGEITLEELADQIHLCKSESCRLFKRYMKESLFDYLLAYRVELSLELLRHTDLDVTGIAGNCGFTNPGYYARIFRRKMGCTPLQYRKNRRES